MNLVDVTGGGPLLDEIYDDVFRPSFSFDELSPRRELAGALARGEAVVTAVVDDDGRPVAAAAGEWSPQTRVLLLSYVAVRPGVRSRGYGARLMDAVGGSWQERFRPLVTLVEFEHPLAHGSDPKRGDPAARFRFYARHGARALALPYFQPALGGRRKRIYGMVLAAVCVTPEARGERDGTVAAGPVRGFLTDYFLTTEEKVPTDPAARRLWRAVDARGGIPLLDLADAADLEVSRAG
ncbi:GNAT family N-acetyltransferase [Streptomyces sp. NPDC005435]|uniref:GNAT family N-acetyltransferase n=1 Tax=Streptomyces sp. NPDC005435 TaxID=3154464 RepID=UPI0034517866